MDSTWCVSTVQGAMLQTRINEGMAHAWVPFMGLASAFDSALPSRPWRPAVTGNAFVALFDLRDWRAWVVDAHAMLHVPERQRVERHRSAGHRDRLALAYALHRLLLARALDCDADEVPIIRDAAGCPRLPGTAYSTSLSHADSGLALAISASGPVGVDMEWSARAAVLPEIADQLCHPEDRTRMAGLPWAEWNQALLGLWVRKEAFLKAAGVGLQLDMHGFAAPDNATLPLPGGDASRVRMLDAGPHWTAAVAAPPDACVATAWLRPTRLAAAGQF